MARTPSIPMALLALLALLGCRPMQVMPTPSLHTTASTEPFGRVPAHFRHNHANVLYVTDRNRETTETGGLTYGHRRSWAVSFGLAKVQMGDGLSWERLVEQSVARERTHEMALRMRGVTERGRFPPTPLPSIARKDGWQVDPAAIADEERAATEFQTLVRERLALTPRKEAYIFTHGVNCGFDGSAFVIGEFWHFLEREGVPISYTWPAGYGGLKGYFYDTESAEFTVYHFKQFLKWLSGVPELEKIHIVSHSRGTGIVVSALRELVIELRSAGESPRRRLKIENVILLAPDLDIDVVYQRMTTERVANEVGRMTVYVSEGDRAVGLTDIWFRSEQRLALLRVDDIPENVMMGLRRSDQISIIDVQAKSSLSGHSYYVASPEVSSDIILTLRGHAPGAEHGRPLTRKDGNFWILEEGYLEDEK